MSNSLRKALSILLIISEKAGRNGLPIRDLARLSKLPPSTVHRLLQTFKEFDILDQDPATQNYRLGPQLLVMGMQARGWMDLRNTAMPVLQDLTEQTREDSYLTVDQGNLGIFIERVEGPYPIKVLETFGSQVPLHCGASRKAILAFKDDDWIRRYIDRGLVKFTENTITRPDVLLREIETIRRDGYAVSFCEYLEHAVGVAAPVRDYTGSVIASIGVIVLAMRFSEERKPELVNQVKAAAGRLSRKMGYSPAAPGAPGSSGRPRPAGKFFDGGG